MNQWMVGDGVDVVGRSRMKSVAFFFVFCKFLKPLKNGLNEWKKKGMKANNNKQPKWKKNGIFG